MSERKRDEMLTLLNAAIRAEKDRNVLDDPYKTLERLGEAREILDGWIEDLERHLENEEAGVDAVRN